ncbi:MAG: 30S ribosomal protein S8 [bacterium]
MVIDPIADMLIRIKNAQSVKHKTVVIPFSKIKLSLAEVLNKNGWLGDIKTGGKKIDKYIELELKYDIDGQPLIKELKRVSKCGCRIYIKKDEIRSLHQGYGLSVISTSKGLMSDMEAKKIGLGGEVICQVW